MTEAIAVIDTRVDGATTVHSNAPTMRRNYCRAHASAEIETSADHKQVVVRLYEGPQQRLGHTVVLHGSNATVIANSTAALMLLSPRKTDRLLAQLRSIAPEDVEDTFVATFKALARRAARWPAPVRATAA